MLNPLIGTHNFKFADFNPTVIGQEIRWVASQSKDNPGAQKANLFTVVSYEEKLRKKPIDGQLLFVKSSLKITTETGETHIIDPDEEFTANFRYDRANNFDPNFAHTAYNYAEIGADIVGNHIMVMTGANSNHSWGQFITGKVVSYSRSAARPLTALSNESIFYEVGLEGMRRPIVVDSLSSFWA